MPRQDRTYGVVWLLFNTLTQVYSENKWGGKTEFVYQWKSSSAFRLQEGLCWTEALTMKEKPPLCQDYRKGPLRLRPPLHQRLQLMKMKILLRRQSLNSECWEISLLWESKCLGKQFPRDSTQKLLWLSSTGTNIHPKSAAETWQPCLCGADFVGMKDARLKGSWGLTSCILSWSWPYGCWKQNVVVRMRNIPPCAHVLEYLLLSWWECLGTCTGWGFC